MKGNAAAQATQSSRVKPRPVIEKAPELLQLRLILVDPDALANARFGSWSCKNGPMDVGPGRQGRRVSQATMAAISGLTPTMFMTRVRL